MNCAGSLGRSGWAVPDETTRDGREARKGEDVRDLQAGQPLFAWVERYPGRGRRGSASRPAPTSGPASR